MKIFLKYILKSMLEKKGRTLLIIISIAIGAGLFIGSFGVVDILMNTIKEPILAATESREILIKSKNEEPFIDLSKVNLEGVKSVLPGIFLRGSTNDEETKVIGIHSKENKYIDTSNFIQGNIDNLLDETCIISKRISDDLELKINDFLEFNLNGKVQKFKVIAISTNNGIFFGDTDKEFNIIVPYDYIAKMFKADENYNYILAKKTSDNIEDSIESFNKVNEDYVANALISEEALKSNLSIMSNILYVMLFIIVFVSILITYGTMKVSINERISIIGTFLSQGATKSKIKRILYNESLFYGVFGGVLGIPIGYGLLTFLNYQMSPLKDYGIYNNLTINSQYYIYGIIFAVIVAVVSCFIPINSINKLVVKDVILNVNSVHRDIGWKGLLIGGIVFSISAILVYTYKFNGFDYIIRDELIKIVTLILLMFIGLFLLLPKLIDLISDALNKFIRKKGNVFMLAVSNIKVSKVATANIRLIIISIIAVILIKSLGSSMLNVVTDAYTKLNFNIELNIASNEGVNIEDKEKLVNNMMDEINRVEGVKVDSIQYMHYTNFKYKENTSLICGIEPDSYPKYNEYLDFEGDYNKEVYKKFKENPEHMIILSHTQGKMLDVNDGDEILINIDNIEKKFEIAGFIDGKLFNSGLIGFMDLDTMVEYYNIGIPSQVVFDTEKPDEEMKKNLKPIIKRYGASMVTFTEMKKRNIDGNKQIEIFLQYFIIIAIVLSIFGVVNNIIISFLQRKKELSTLTSTGMSSFQRTKILVYESIYSSILACLIGILSGTVFLKAVSNLLSIFLKGMPLAMEFYLIPAILGVTITVIIIATIPVLLKNRNLSVVDQLRYE